jgi:hypothetical protein
VAVLAAIAIAATFAEPFIAPAATVITVVVALLAGTAVAESLLHAVGLRSADPAGHEAAASAGEPGGAFSPVTRSREAGPGQATSVGRGGFLLLGGAAAVVGLVAAGVGRALTGGAAQQASAPKKLDLPDAPAKKSGGDEKQEGSGAKKSATNETLPPPPKDASIDLPGMPKLITPASSFYLIDTALSSPRIDVNSWKLSVRGAVQNPVEFSYKDLLGMSTREADITLSCVSNTVGGG